MKKGISLVALVITIIVLIILTAAVILTGGDAPEQAQRAVFFNDVSSVQDAVTLKILNNIADMNDPALTTKPATKYDGVISTTDISDIGSATPAGTQVITIAAGDTRRVYSITATPASLNLAINSTELAKYAIDANGVVYYWNAGVGKPFTINNVLTTYFTTTLSATGAFVAGTVSGS